MPWIKLVFFIVFAAVYATVFAIKKLNEQAAAKRAREERERQKLDSLRTGRSVEGAGAATVAAPSGPLSSQDAARRLQELAERRRLQLEELRRRAAAQAGGAAPVPASAAPSGTPRFAPATVAAPRPRVGAPVARVPRQTVGKRPAPVRPAPARGQARGQARAQQPADPARRERALLKSAERVQAIDAEKLAKRAAPQLKAEEPVARAAPAAPTAARPGAARLVVPKGKAGVAVWRHIILLREVLAPPVALRRPDQDVL